MELKSKKYIKNTKTLPGFSEGFNYSAIPTIMSTLGDIYGTYNNYENADDLIAQTDTRIGNVGGVRYLYRTGLDTNEIESDQNKKVLGGTINGLAKGAAAGSMILPGLGTAAGALVGGITSLIGGLDSKDKLMELARLANIKLYNSNSFNQAFASSKNLRMENARKGYTNAGQTLSGYAKGKPVYSAEGVIDNEATARVSNGEIIGNFADGYVSRVPGKKNNKDTKLASIKNDDFVITNKYGLSDYAAETGDYEGALNMQERLMNYKNGKKPCCKDGKLPKLVDGLLLNGIGAGIGALGGIYQFFDANNQRIKNPHTYALNTYDNEIINTLNNIRVSDIPIVNQYLSAEARANDAIRNSGGLSAGQRVLSRIAALNNTLANIGKLNTANQVQNNAYKTQYANALATLGQQDRQARMLANQWDLDYYSKAHAARQQGKQMGMYNTINHVLEGLKGAYNIDMYNKTYNLYAQEQARKDAETQAIIDSLKKPSVKSNAKPVSTTPMSRDAGSSRNNTQIKDKQGRVLWTPERGIIWGNLIPSFDFPGLNFNTSSAVTNIPSTRSYPSVDDQLRYNRYIYENSPEVNGGLSENIAARRFNMADLIPWLKQ